MPFDGSESYLALGLRPLDEVPVASSARRPLAAWLRGVLLGGDADADAWALLPAQRGADPEIPALRLLEAARLLIASEEAWVQGAYHTSTGRHCAIGALRAVAAQMHGHGGGGGRGAKMQAHTLLLAVARQRGFDSVETMNDRSSHVQVLAAFDAAIASAASRPAVR
jgi:hypothetical protein